MLRSDTVRRRLFARCLAGPMAVALLAWGCATKPTGPVPLPLGAVGTSVVHYAGTVLSGPGSGAVSAVDPASAGEISPSTTRVKKSMPTARTRGAANGSLMIGSVSSEASARAAATIVAVAPTLEARSQLSVSLRVIITLPSTPSCSPLIFSQGKEAPETLRPVARASHPVGGGALRALLVS